MKHLRSLLASIIFVLIATTTINAEVPLYAMYDPCPIAAAKISLPSRFDIFTYAWKIDETKVEPVKNDEPKEPPAKLYSPVYHYGEAVQMTDYEYELLCDVVCLEAGGEGEDMQRAVTEVIYNRLMSGIWGTTISEVIFSPYQFEVVPYLWKADPSELTKRVVSEVFGGALTINYNVLYFRTDYYHQWYGAVSEFNIGNVYFSSSIWY